jgi:hypothetical protein
MVKMKDYAICYQRNRLRPKEKWVPDSVIDDMMGSIRKKPSRIPM